MIYLWMLGLAVVLMAPLGWAFSSGRRQARGRREAALALHRAQLAELERDRADGRIDDTEYAGARLEVQRRLLAADALAEPAATGNAKLLLAGTAAAVPILAFALYLPGSTPAVPSEPHTRWLAQQQAEQKQLATIIAALRAKLAGMDADSAAASQGQAYLGEALAEQAQTITPEALALFRQSLAHAPPDASWRALAQQRVAQATGS